MEFPNPQQDPSRCYDENRRCDVWEVLGWLQQVSVASRAKYPPEETVAILALHDCNIPRASSVETDALQQYVIDRETTAGFAELLSFTIYLHPGLQAQVLELPTIKQALRNSVLGLCRWADNRGLLDDRDVTDKSRWP